MNDILFDQRIAAAFAAMSPADDYLKARLLCLPDEQAKPAPRLTPWKLLPITAAAAAIVLIATVVLNNIPRVPPELPLIQYEGMFGDSGGMGGGMGGVWSKSAAELHRDSPAFGREGELGIMPVYRNPSYGKALALDTAGAMEIAARFSRAMGKTYTYVPTDTWEQIEQKIRENAPPEHLEEALEANRQNEWEFRCGEERLRIYDHYGIGVSLNAPLPASQFKGDGTAARYEAMCQQVYDRYASAIESMTGLRFNKASTALTGYDIYGEKDFETFFYLNNPGDPVAKQAEDYALNRLRVGVLEERDYIDYGLDSEGNTVETVSHQDAEFYLGFCPTTLGKSDLLGNYPVMDLESARRELLAGRYEALSEVTADMLARATIEDVELVYNNSPWLKTWLPVYRFSVLFAPEDMEEPPRAVEFGLRTYYDFYVPAVPAGYLVPQEVDGNTPRPVGGASGNNGAALSGKPNGLTEDIFAVYTEGGTYHVKYVGPMAGGGLATTEIYAKGESIAMLWPDDPDYNHEIIKDGYNYRVSDSRKTVVKTPLDDTITWPIPPEFTAMCFVGSGRANFMGEQLDYDEYSHNAGFQAFYFIKDGVLKGIRHAEEGFQTIDVEYLVFEKESPDSVFDIPADYTVAIG